MEEIPDIDLRETIPKITKTRLRLRRKNFQNHCDKTQREIEYLSTLIPQCKNDEERTAVKTRITTMSYILLSFKNQVEDLNYLLRGKVPPSYIRQQQQQQQKEANRLGAEAHTNDPIEDTGDKTYEDTPTAPFS